MRGSFASKEQNNPELPQYILDDIVMKLGRLTVEKDIPVLQHPCTSNIYVFSSTFVQWPML